VHVQMHIHKHVM